MKLIFWPSDQYGRAPPKWYKRPAGASFGFGGKLVGFRPRPSAAGVPAGASEVYVHTLVTEYSLVSRLSEFEAAIQNGERSLLRVLCEKKSQETDRWSHTWEYRYTTDGALLASIGPKWFGQTPTQNSISRVVVLKADDGAVGVMHGSVAKLFFY
uniref:Uncharacterized protein n=1 Tax=Quercus lobata TaxID=97700 RepID=A0A7N2LZU5_QUELO